jgi:hypothetical protein
MTTRRVALVVLGSLVLASFPAMVAAEGTSCGSPTFVVPDGRVIESTIPNGATFAFVFFALAGRSYTFEVSQTLSAFGTSPGTITAFNNAPVCSTPIAGLVHNYLTDPNLGNTGPQVGDRVAFNGFNGFGGFTINNASGVAVSYSFSANETTMFSPAWSTIGTYNTYYSFYNTTNASITGVLTLTKTDGTAAGSTTLVIPALQTAATNTVALGTPTGAAGTAIFTHLGPASAILVEADIANFSTTPAYIQPVKFQSPRDKR